MRGRRYLFAFVLVIIVIGAAIAAYVFRDDLALARSGAAATTGTVPPPADAHAMPMPAGDVPRGDVSIDARLVEAARQRLALWDMSASEIATVERTREPIAAVTVTAPA